MTEKTTNEASGLPALGEALERYGADRTRWPAPVRRNFASLLSANAEARARLREAEALDRLLDLAPQPAFDTRALSDRILAAVERERPPAVPSHGRWPISRRRAPAATEAPWPAAALLAASLVLGAFFGLAGTFDQTVGPMIASASADTEIDAGRIALESGGLELFEEELL